MKAKINLWIIAFILLAAAAYAQTEYFSLKLAKIDSNFTLKDVSVVPSNAGYINSSGVYRAESISFQNIALSSIDFGGAFLESWEYINPKTGNIDSGGSFPSANADYIVYLPYDKNAKEIKVYDIANQTMLTIDISDYSAAKMKDGICDYAIDGICDPDCAGMLDQDCVQKQAQKESPSNIVQVQPGTVVVQSSVKGRLMNAIITSITIIIIFIVLLTLIRKSKKR